MADKKFSELNAAGTITGSEVVAIVQSGASVRTTTAAIANAATVLGAYTSGAHLPTTDGASDLGSASFRWDQVFSLGIEPVLSTFAPRLCHTGGQPAITTTTPGTDTTPVTTETYLAEVFVPCDCTITGLALFNGSAVAGNITVYLSNHASTNLASSASTAQSGIAGYQLIPFSSTYAARGPAMYFVLVQFDSTSARFRSHAIGAFGSGKLTSTTYGNFPTAFTPPTTFTASLGPIGTLY